MDPTIVGLIIGVILVIVTVLLIMMGRVKQPVRPEEVSRAVEAPVPQAPAKMDDLILIEGIGPKIADLLKQAGITTFAQLAAADVSSLEKLLQENGLQFAKPQSWGEQARLAAEGKMDELKALQEKLVAGR